MRVCSNASGAPCFLSSSHNSIRSACGNGSGGLPFTAVIEMSALVNPKDLGGQALIYLPRYAASDDEAWTWTDAEIEERFLIGLERMYPAFRRGDVTAFRISRVKHVMALPTLGAMPTSRR